MGKCERCGTELERSEWTDKPVEADEAHNIHDADACADRLKTQRDEALAREEELSTQLTNEKMLAEDGWSRFHHAADQNAALRAELARKTERIGELEKGLAWYADPDGGYDNGAWAKRLLASLKAGGPVKCDKCGWAESAAIHAHGCSKAGTPPREPDPFEDKVMAVWVSIYGHVPFSGDVGDVAKWIDALRSVHNEAVEECAKVVENEPHPINSHGRALNEDRVERIRALAR